MVPRAPFPAASRHPGWNHDPVPCAPAAARRCADRFPRAAAGPAALGSSVFRGWRRDACGSGPRGADAGLGLAALPQARGRARLRSAGPAVAQRPPRGGPAGRRRGCGQRTGRGTGQFCRCGGGPPGADHRSRGRSTEQLRTRGDDPAGRGPGGGRVPGGCGGGRAVRTGRPLRRHAVPSLGCPPRRGVPEPPRVRPGPAALGAAAAGPGAGVGVRRSRRSR